MKKILIVMVFLVIVGGCFFVYGIFNDNLENKLIGEEIFNNYDQVVKLISDYNDRRDSLIDYLDIYYDDKFYNDYDNIIKTIKSEGEVVLEIGNYIKKIDNKCRDHVFSKIEVNNICDSYKSDYEKIVNVYVNDYKNINLNISKYNSKNVNSLEMYIDENKIDYIDYDNDSKYLEMEDLS